MGIKDIWNRLIGREAEIDYSAPIDNSKVLAGWENFQPGAFRMPNVTSIVGVDFAGAKEYSISAASCALKPRARRSVKAHGTASSKPKRRSSKKKKPSTRKSTRK